MKTTATDKVLATGQWYSIKDCPDSPKRLRDGGGIHSFQDISSKPSKVPDEVLVTSQCKYCKGLIVDCPTIALAEFIA